MTPELWIGFVGLALTIVTTSAVGIRHLGRQQSKRAVQEALLTKAVNGLSAEVRRLAESNDRLDKRLDKHEVRLAVLEESRK